MVVGCISAIIVSGTSNIRISTSDVVGCISAISIRVTSIPVAIGLLAWLDP